MDDRNEQGEGRGRTGTRWRIEKRTGWNNKINKKEEKDGEEKRKRGRKLEKELKRHSASNHRADWLAGARDRPDPGQIN